jgi:hypothetical protein
VVVVTTTLVAGAADVVVVVVLGRVDVDVGTAGTAGLAATTAFESREEAQPETSRPTIAGAMKYRLRLCLPAIRALRAQNVQDDRS